MIRNYNPSVWIPTSYSTSYDELLWAKDSKLDELIKWINGKDNNRFIGSICKYLGRIWLEGKLYECMKCITEGTSNCWCKKIISSYQPIGNNHGGCTPGLGCNPPVREFSLGRDFQGCFFEE